MVKTEAPAYAKAAGNSYSLHLPLARLSSTLQQESWVAFAVALFVYGTFSSFLPGATVHELGHGAVSRTKWLTTNCFCTSLACQAGGTLLTTH